MAKHGFTLERVAADLPRLEALYLSFIFGLEIKFALTRTRITRRQLLRQAGATGALALSASGLAAGEGTAGPASRSVERGRATPKTESQAAEKYAHPPGVFINRPLTQVSRMADALLDDMEGRNCDFFFNEASPRSGLVRDRAPPSEDFLAG